MAETSMLTTRYVRRLGKHHFAHLRSVAEGIDIQDSAKRYLGVEHGHEAQTAHTQTRDAVRALARRHGDSAWHLIGVHIKLKDAANRPTLEDFMSERDLDGWSETDVVEMYREAYPEDRRNARRTRLQERQIKLLYQMEGEAAEQPLGTDLISGWFDDVTATKLIAAGMLTLGDLNSKISLGGRWYSALPGIGRAKAGRIASHMSSLIPHLSTRQKTQFSLVTTPSLFALASPSESPPNDLTYPTKTLSADQSTLLSASNDQEAVEAWIAARAGSALTATAYRREATRLMLWLQYACAGKTLSRMTANDCGDYMAFLQDVPEKWMSRARAKPGEPGWAPFRGKLGHSSQSQSVVIVAALFRWLQSARYLQANPWDLINQKTGDDADHKMLDTKAFSESAISEILRFIEIQPPTPSRSRILFILRFCEAVGLRSAELLNARLGDFRLEPEGWVVQIHGKGAKNRIAAVPGQAFAALQEYLAARGLEGIETAPPQAPLLASAIEPTRPIGYQALYEHVKGWLSKAIANSALPSNERLKLVGASTHWLRHTFGTRAIAREVPLDVIQAQMGHGSIQTTASIYGRAPIKRRVDELGKAFG